MRGHRQALRRHCGAVLQRGPHGLRDDRHLRDGRVVQPRRVHGPHLRGGGKRCLGKKVQTCNADRTGFADTETCAIDCDGGTSAACLKVTQLAASDHTCALLSNKTLRCWGENTNLGALGTAGPALRPTQVAGVSNVSRVAVARNATAALLSDGNVVWWGQPPTVGSAIGPTNAGLGVGIAPTDLALATTHLCIRDTDTLVKCLGSNAHGNLGDGTKTTSPSLVTATGTSGVGPLAVGDGISFSVVSSTEARGWGSNSWVLGDGSTTDRLVPTATYPGAQQIVVSSDAQFSCARYSTGIVKCSGAGAVCGGSTYTTPTPITGLTNVTQLTAGVLTACALSGDGTVRCWGEPSLGDGSYTFSTSPVLVSLGGTAVSVAYGSSFGCAVMSDQTTVKCWGGAAFLGVDSTSGDYPTPTPVLW